MKRVLITMAGAAWLLMATKASAWEGQIVVSTPNTSMVLHANEGEDLKMDYFGAKLSDASPLKEAGCDLNFAALPTFGTVDMIHLPALQVQHVDGNLTFGEG